MNYWLFAVLYDSRPELWPTLLDTGLAAQQYPAGWTNEARNVNALKRLKRGDAIVAAFMRHRFGGYGILTSDFFRGGRSLSIPAEDNFHEFQERATVDWSAIPLETAKPYVDCHSLKAEGYDIDLRVGSCLRQIDERTYLKLRKMLDNAGAEPVRRVPNLLLPEEIAHSEELIEGAVRSIVVNAYERNPEARRRCIEAHGTCCCICGFDFGEVYGVVAEGYIHVHHLRPLSEIKEEYVVDPVNDLRPVCPNCHAVLHLGGECRGIDDVVQLVNQKSV